MALFFDLSIPYLEAKPSPATAAKSCNEVRLRSVVKAMELGYAGVAYDRSFRGIITEGDRCKIPPFPLASLLAAAPAVRSAVSFHRELLGSPVSAPFRQYTRLTVLVDSVAAANALHGVNPLFRSYDILAARPLNQASFDQVCQVSEVDLISINFTEKRPFRLKLPMVEAAIKRGVHFEIAYSGLVADIHSRKHMLSDAKLLVDWTRGRNIIISSAASNVNELRGPYDVINLCAFLLGFSVERAKAAISRNCRSLVGNALRKKHCYIEAIRVERIPDEKVELKGVWFGNWNDWDPISSGQGDVPPLSDITKALSSTSNQHKSPTAIGSELVVDKVQHKDQLSGARLCTSDDISNLPSMEPFRQQRCSSESALIAHSEMTGSVPEAKEPGLMAAVNDEIVAAEGNLVSLDATLTCPFNSESKTPSDAVMEDRESSDEPDSILVTDENHDNTKKLVNGISIVDCDQILPDDRERRIFVPTENHLLKDKVGIGMGGQEMKENMHIIPLQYFVQQQGKLVDGTGTLADCVLLEDAYIKTNDLRKEVPLAEKDALLKGVLTRKAEQKENLSTSNAEKISSKLKSGKGRRKKMVLSPAFPLPLKSLFKPAFFKNRSSQIRRRSNS